MNLLPICCVCDEPIEPAERAPVDGKPIHRDCLVRMVVGGVNHQLGRCTCCGGDQPPDPPELSRREAARQAVAMWRAANGLGPPP